MPEKPSTLKDIANKAGVSAMTVSNVLNNRSGASDETKRRVYEVAQELNYTPNQVAQSLRSTKTNTIGVVMSDSSQYVFSQLLSGVEQAASEIGYSVLLANTGQRRYYESKAIDLLVSKRIDGLLLAAPLAVGPGDVARIKSSHVPFVLLMRAPEATEADYVANDNYLGGYLAVQHLCDIGEKEFYLLSLDSTSGKQRMKGYLTCLSDRGFNKSDYQIERIPPFIEDGYNAMKRILDQGRRNGAVCCGCDMIAVGAIKAIYERGLAIPKDFRIIGYDDFDMAPHLRVPLTTIHQPVRQIGLEGFRILIDRINNPKTHYRSVVLRPELVVRESTVRRNEAK